MQRNVLSYLNNIVTKKPDKTAFSDGERSLTFREVYRQSRGVGTCLHQQGVYKRPVAVFMKKSPLEIAAFFGAVTAGCFYVPLDVEMPSGRIQLILDNVRAPIVICDRDTADAICIEEQGGYQFRLFPDGEENPALHTGDGISLYRWDGEAAVSRTAEEIEADLTALPEPAPSEQERLRADIDFLAAMANIQL